MNTDPESAPADRVHDIPRILAALGQAVQEALLSHKLAGNPVAIWKDGRVELVQPEDIPVPTPGKPGHEGGRHGGPHSLGGAGLAARRKEGIRPHRRG